MEADALEKVKEELEKLADRVAFLDVDESGLELLVTEEDVANLYPPSSFAHILLMELLRHGDSHGASMASRLLEQAAVASQKGPTRP